MSYNAQCIVMLMFGVWHYKIIDAVIFNHHLFNHGYLTRNRPLFSNYNLITVLKDF